MNCGLQEQPKHAKAAAAAAAMARGMLESAVILLEAGEDLGRNAASATNGGL
jgi:hypothetical protein